MQIDKKLLRRLFLLARGVSMLLTVLCDSIVFRQKITGNVWAALAFIFAAIALTSL